MLYKSPRVAHVKMFEPDQRHLVVTDDGTVNIPAPAILALSRVIQVLIRRHTQYPMAIMHTCDAVSSILDR